MERHSNKQSKNPRAQTEAFSFNVANAFLCQTFSHSHTEHDNLNKFFPMFHCFPPIFFLLLIPQRGEGREKERERSIEVREKHLLIGCFLYAPQLGTQRTAPTSALTRKPTSNLSICQTTPNQLSTLARDFPKVFCKFILLPAQYKCIFPRLGIPFGPMQHTKKLIAFLVSRSINPFRELSCRNSYTG